VWVWVTLSFPQTCAILHSELIEALTVHGIQRYIGSSCAKFWGNTHGPVLL